MDNKTKQEIQNGKGNLEKTLKINKTELYNMLSEYMKVNLTVDAYLYLIQKEIKKKIIKGITKEKQIRKELASCYDELASLAWKNEEIDYSEITFREIEERRNKSKKYKLLYIIGLVFILIIGIVLIALQMFMIAIIPAVFLISLSLGKKVD